MTAFGSACFCVLPIDVTVEILLKYLRETGPEGWRRVHPPLGGDP